MLGNFNEMADRKTSQNIRAFQSYIKIIRLFFLGIYVSSKIVKLTQDVTTGINVIEELASTR